MSPVPAGKMDKPVKLQKRTFTEDAMKGQKETWTTVQDPFWVSIEPMRIQQNVELAQQFPSATHKVVGRYEDGIASQTHRFQYGSRILRIDHVMNPMEASETLEFVCEEQPASAEQQV